MNTTETKPGVPVETAAGEKFDVLGSVAELYSSGIQRLATIQKQGLEIALQQNAEIVGMWKKHANGSLVNSGPFLFDLAATMFERFAETQKGAIDLVVEQSNAFADAVKERKGKAAKAGEEGIAIAKEAVEQSVAAQKTALDYSAKQAKAAFKSAKQQFGYAGTPAEAAADSLERGMEVAIEAQKDILDVLKAPIQTLH